MHNASFHTDAFCSNASNCTQMSACGMQHFCSSMLVCFMLAIHGKGLTIVFHQTAGEQGRVDESIKQKDSLSRRSAPMCGLILRACIGGHTTSYSLTIIWWHLKEPECVRWKIHCRISSPGEYKQHRIIQTASIAILSKLEQTLTRIVVAFVVVISSTVCAGMVQTRHSAKWNCYWHGMFVMNVSSELPMQLRDGAVKFRLAIVVALTSLGGCCSQTIVSRNTTPLAFHIYIVCSGVRGGTCLLQNLPRDGLHALLSLKMSRWTALGPSKHYQNT